MATKNTPQPTEVIETEAEEVTPVFIGDRRPIVVHFVGQILAGQKFDLDGKLPNQETRNKIVSFAMKLADDVIAATN